jgi:hypothetical protein
VALARSCSLSLPFVVVNSACRKVAQSEGNPGCAHWRDTSSSQISVVLMFCMGLVPGESPSSSLSSREFTYRSTTARRSRFDNSMMVLFFFSAGPEYTFTEEKRRDAGGCPVQYSTRVPGYPGIPGTIYTLPSARLCCFLFPCAPARYPNPASRVSLDHSRKPSLSHLRLFVAVSTPYG